MLRALTRNLLTYLILSKGVVIWYRADHGSAGMAHHKVPYRPTSTTQSHTVPLPAMNLNMFIDRLLSHTTDDRLFHTTSTENAKLCFATIIAMPIIPRWFIPSKANTSGDETSPTSCVTSADSTNALNRQANTRSISQVNDVDRRGLQ